MADSREVWGYEGCMKLYEEHFVYNTTLIQPSYKPLHTTLLPTYRVWGLYAKWLILGCMRGTLYEGQYSWHTGRASIAGSQRGYVCPILLHICYMCLILLLICYICVLYYCISAIYVSHTTAYLLYVSHTTAYLLRMCLILLLICYICVSYYCLSAKCVQY